MQANKQPMYSPGPQNTQPFTPDSNPVNKSFDHAGVLNMSYNCEDKRTISSIGF